MAVIKHIFAVNASIGSIYKAITTIEGLQSWWTPDTKGDAQVNGEIVFGFGDSLFTIMRVDQLEENKQIKWTCMQSSFPEGKQWVGTTVSFSLSPNSDKTIKVIFEHDNWKDATDYYGVCTYHWGNFMNSLKSLCEKGAGNPAKF